jgi:hypothetical protein
MIEVEEVNSSRRVTSGTNHGREPDVLDKTKRDLASQGQIMTYLV